MKLAKQHHTLITVLVTILNLIFLDITYAESESACRTYANGAVSSYKTAKSLNCPVSGARWQDNYDNHYKWCLGAPPDWLNNENNARASLIKVCQKDPTALRCDGYARKAIAQSQEAAARGCGMDNGPRWTASYENHLTWCINNPPSVAESENKEREGPLSLCRTINPLPGGGSGTSNRGEAHCAADCDVCTREGLRCTSSGDCQAKYPTTAMWQCY